MGPFWPGRCEASATSVVGFLRPGRLDGEGDQALLAGADADAVVYPGVYHMFDRGKEPSMKSDTTINGTHVAYDGAAAKDAQARTIAWFKTNLK